MSQIPALDALTRPSQAKPDPRAANPGEVRGQPGGDVKGDGTSRNGDSPPSFAETMRREEAGARATPSTGQAAPPAKAAGKTEATAQGENASAARAQSTDTGPVDADRFAKDVGADIGVAETALPGRDGHRPASQASGDADGAAALRGDAPRTAPSAATTPDTSAATSKQAATRTEAQAALAATQHAQTQTPKGQAQHIPGGTQPGSAAVPGGKAPATRAGAEMPVQAPAGGDARPAPSGQPTPTAPGTAATAIQPDPRQAAAPGATTSAMPTGQTQGAAPAIVATPSAASAPSTPGTAPIPDGAVQMAAATPLPRHVAGAPPEGAPLHRVLSNGSPAAPAPASPGDTPPGKLRTAQAASLLTAPAAPQASNPALPAGLSGYGAIPAPGADVSAQALATATAPAPQATTLAALPGAAAQAHRTATPAPADARAARQAADTPPADAAPRIASAPAQPLASGAASTATQAAMPGGGATAAKGQSAFLSEDGMAFAAEADLATGAADAPRGARADGATLAPTPLDPRGAQTSAQIGQQMAAAARQTAPGTMELRLNPEELGRLRLHFDTTDNVLVVSITADRAETTDLMRRHIDQLAREMQTLGYRDVSFRFAGEEHASGSGGRPGGQMPGGDAAAQPVAGGVDEAPLAAAQQPHPRLQGGLDLRI